MQQLSVLALVLVLRAGPDAPPAVRPSAEEEIDALLSASAQKAPPAELRVVLEGPASSLYRLEQGSVQLDGVPVAVAPASSSLKGKATQVSDGDHVVSARLVYRGQALGPRPWEEGPRWTLPARVAVQARHGLRFTIHFTVEVNERAPVPGERLSLSYTVEPEMLMALDDAPMAPPPTPQLPATVPVALPPMTAPPLIATPGASPPAAPAKKKQRAKAKSAAVAVSTVPAPKAAATTAAADPLEQATERLRSALAAPRDAGAPAGAETPH